SKAGRHRKTTATRRQSRREPTGWWLSVPQRRGERAFSGLRYLGNGILERSPPSARPRVLSPCRDRARRVRTSPSRPPRRGPTRRYRPQGVLEEASVAAGVSRSWTSRRLELAREQTAGSHEEIYDERT